MLCVEVKVLFYLITDNKLKTSDIQYAMLFITEER